MVNIIPMDQGYDCQVTIWPSKYKSVLSVCDKLPHRETKSTEIGG